MTEIEDAINILRELDLSKYPIEQVIGQIGRLKRIGAVKTTLHPGKVILRARPNYNGERYSTVEELSYKPAKDNKTFQRASTPNMTMFYGATLPDNVKISQRDNARVVGAFESVKLLRDPDSDTSGEQVITYGKWGVTKNIPLITIVNHKTFLERNPSAGDLYNAYQDFLKAQTQEIIDNSTLVMDFLANEFGKKDISGNYDYIISAIFTEMIVRNGHAAGILYPSVRTGGVGFNVAIHPSFVDHMELEAAGECTVYKHGKRTIVDNETQAIVPSGQKGFKLEPVPPQHHVGREKIIKELYC